MNFFEYFNSKPCDCILPSENGKGGLYLGNIDSAKPSEIQKFGIKAVLTVAAYTNLKYDESIIHKVVEADDAQS